MSKLPSHKRSNRFQRQTILISALLLSGLSVKPVISVSAPPGVINNQATGTFVDDIDTTNTVVTIESNPVQVTVIEVAGISISDPTISEPTATIIGATAAPFQGIGGINQNDIVYFDFEITNIGNDPTQFFIPGSPFTVLNGTFDRTLYGAVQIIQIKNATGAIVPLVGNVTKIDIPAAGANTGDLTVLGLPAGSIPAGGSVTVRIPIKVTGGSGTSIKVGLGDTDANDNLAGTVNQTYTASTTTGADVRTKDNPDNLTLNTPVADETNGVLATSAEKEASRFGLAPIVATPQVIGFKSAKLTDSNNDTKINPGETVTWTISYANTGTIDVTNFQLTDFLPIGVTKSGAISIVGGNGQTSPTANSNYTGTNNTPGTTDTLFNTPVTFNAGGKIVVTIPVTINTGVTGSLTNQSTATAANLPPVGILTDNAGATADLPSTVTTAPYSLTVPTSSVSQTINTSIDPTLITINPSFIPPPFATCPAPAYITQGADNANIKLYSANLSQGTLAPISANNFPYGVNAIGFNQKDRYIYGSKIGSNNIVRIDADGVSYDLGAVTGLPSASYNVGDVNADGILYLMIGSNPTTMYGVDVDSNSPNFLKLVQTVTVPASPSLKPIQDFAFHPTNGKLYTMQGSTWKLFEISWGTGTTVTATVTDRGIPNNFPPTPTPSGSDAHGAIYFDNQGTLYTYRNGGQIYKVKNVVSGTPVATTLTSNATAVPQNDGARCALAPPITSPNLLLVKRITAINGLPSKRNGNSLANYENDPSNPYDDNQNATPVAPYTRLTTDKWPLTNNLGTASTFLIGAIDGGTIRPNDTVEYTIYFLSAGDSEAKNVLFCDRVPDNVTFIPNGFNSVDADPLGLSTADRGIAISFGSTLKSYTNISDGDIARYYPPLSEPINDFPKINCGGANTNGAVVVNLGNRPNAAGTAADNAAGAYGFVRFRGQVK